jgi:hypothetical protein
MIGQVEQVDTNCERCCSGRGEFLNGAHGGRGVKSGGVVEVDD